MSRLSENLRRMRARMRGERERLSRVIGLSAAEDGGPVQAQLDCLNAGKWWLDGVCLTAAEFAQQVCEQQLGGHWDPASGSCSMTAQTGLSQAACETIGGVWDPATQSCAMPTGPTTPPGQTPTPPATRPGGVPWGTLGFVALGIGVLYLGSTAGRKPIRI